MKENFEDKLSRKIKTSLENHQEPFDPALWKDMKSRLQKTNTKKAFFLNRKTLSLLILLLLGISGGLGYWATQSPVKTQATAEKTQATAEKTRATTERTQATTERTQVTESLENTQATAKRTQVIAEKITMESPIRTQATAKRTQVIAEKITMESPIRTQATVDSKQETTEKITMGSSVKTQATSEKTQIITTKETFNYLSTTPIKSLFSLNEFSPLLSDSSFVMMNIPLNTDSTEIQKSDLLSSLRWGIAFNVMNGTQRKEEFPYKNKLSFGGGLTFALPLSDRLSIQSGLILTQQTWKRENQWTNVPQFSDVNIGSGNTDNSDFSIEEKLNILYLEIPLEVRYTLLQKSKYNLGLQAGFSSLWYIQQKYNASPTDISYFDMSPANAQYFGFAINEFNDSKNQSSAFSRFEAFQMLNLSISMNYQLNDKFTLHLAPFYKTSLGKMTSEQIKTRLIGLQIGLGLKK
jgi:hypothetical protein